MKCFRILETCAIAQKNKKTTEQNTSIFCTKTNWVYNGIHRRLMLFNRTPTLSKNMEFELPEIFWF